MAEKDPSETPSPATEAGPGTNTYTGKPGKPGPISFEEVDDIWSKRMTRYELVCVVSSRVEQLSRGAPSTVPDADEPLMATALRELEAGVLPLTVTRTMPDGTTRTLKCKDLKPPKRTLQHMRSLGFLPTNENV